MCNIIQTDEEMITYTFIDEYYHIVLCSIKQTCTYIYNKKEFSYAGYKCHLSKRYA